MDESEGEKVVGGCDDHLHGSPLGVYADVSSHQTTERNLSEIIRQLSVRDEAPTKEEICSLWNEARGAGCVSVAFDVGRLLVRLPLTETVNSLPDFSVILTNDSVLLSALISKAISVKDKKATAKLCDYVRAEHVDLLESLFTLFEDLVRTDQREESDAAAIALYVVTDQTIGDVTTESVRRKRNDCLRLALNFTESRFVRKCGSAALAKIVVRDTVWTDYLIVVDTLEEPQSHLIRPILSKFDVLLAAISPTDDSARKDSLSIPFTWEWLQIAFAKSIRHTNGWVRLWTFEKILTIPAEHFSVDFAFIFDDFLSLINDNDVFWRLDDEGRLTDFINNLGVFLARVAAAIDSFSIESNENVRFYGRLLTLFDSPWSPFPLLFVSRALKTLPIFPAFASKIHFEQMRRILQFVANLQYIPLRLVALTNFSVLFIRLICWTDDVLPQLPSLLAFLPAALLERDQTIPHTINSILVIPGSSMLSTANASALLQSIFLHTSDQHVDEMLSAARVLWLISDAQDTANSVWDEICVLMAEALSDADDLAMLTAPTELQTDVLLAVWLSRAKIHSTPESLMEMIRRYLDMRLYSLNGSATDRSLLDKLYRPCLSIVDNSDEAVHMSSALTLLTTQASNLSFPKQALLLRIATLDAVEKSSVDCQLIEQYLSSSENVQIRTIEVDCDKNYKHLMTSQFQADRWRLRLRSGAIESASPTAADDLLRECMSTLDSCYSWLERSALFDIIKILLVKVISNADLALEALKCARVVVEEQRKSESYIPALRAFLNLLFSKEVLSCAAISEYAREIFTEFRSTADLNSMVALVLGEALEHSVDMLDSDWVDIVVDMCLYGPVPKKDDRVMYAAYEMARSDSTNKADNGNLAMVHKAPQKARAASVCCLLQLLAKEDAKLIAAILTVTITKSTEFDSSKGISFGLSLAHRQKTRAAQLLLLVVDHCDEKYACKAFDHCLDSLLDSSQQYSIKLLVEWTLVRICLKHDQLKETLWRAEATLAKRRIGSVTSWLSALMHLAIASRSQADVRRCFERFLPWCSAQNFAVRCVAIGALKRLWNYADGDLKTQMTIVEGLLNFDMESAGNARRIIDNLMGDFYFALFDAERHFSIETIFEIFPRNTGLPREEQPGREFFGDTDAASGFRLENQDKSLATAPSLVYSNAYGAASSSRDMSTAVGHPGDPADQDASSHVQRKIDTLLSEFNDRPKRTSSSLIVVASLIDKPANLGGLCRTCEIFGAKTMVIDDMNVVDNMSFKGLSMTAQNWIQLEEVKPQDISNFLEKCRQDGYTIVAAEQTTDSHRLDRFNFPAKTVILLGHEKEGVPVDLIRNVDFTVEIPQVGVVRSLNVHVSGALLIYEFAKQHTFD